MSFASKTGRTGKSACLSTRETLTRREALATLAATAVATGIGHQAMAAEPESAPKKRLRLGVIGTGHRVTHLAGAWCPPELAQFVALADCDLRRVTRFQEAVGKKHSEVGKCAVYQDYRQMLKKEKLDGVFVTTPSHGRVLPCIEACKAGVDIYAEKPITLTIQEGEALIKAVRENKRIFQAGTQARSIPINRYAVEQVLAGAIGKISKVQVANFDGPVGPYKAKPGNTAPAEFNWDMWCGPATLFPFDEKVAMGLEQWGLYSDFDGGGSHWGMTGYGTHAYDQVQWAIEKDGESPVEIRLEEPGDPHSRVTMEYADGLRLEMLEKPRSGPAFGGIFHGEKGKIEINRSRFKCNPEGLVAPPPKEFVESFTRPGGGQFNHVVNWLESMLSRRDPHCPVEAAQRHSILCHLPNIARAVGKKKLTFDSRTYRFVNNDEANQHPIMSRPRREGYELPS
jgi:hypothetical protein